MVAFDAITLWHFRCRGVGAVHHIMSGNTHAEQIRSALPPIPDIVAGLGGGTVTGAMKNQVTDHPTIITEPITMVVMVVSVAKQAIMISGPMCKKQKWSMVKARDALTNLSRILGFVIVRGAGC